MEINQSCKNKSDMYKNGMLSLAEVCRQLSISSATGRNWVKLGKLFPSATRGNSLLFDCAYVEQLKADIQSGKNTALKSRRNKKFVSGSGRYDSYISDTSSNLPALHALLRTVEENQIVVTDEILCMLVAECAIQLIQGKYGKEKCSRSLLAYCSGKLGLGRLSFLVEDLIRLYPMVSGMAGQYPALFGFTYTYEAGEDVLGFLYISLKNIGLRKAAGAYYTPTWVVKSLCARLFGSNKAAGRDVLDPCCGTGNFILQLPPHIPPSRIFGNDIDAMSVKIARINYALKYGIEDSAVIYQHITEGNYLLGDMGRQYDFILGNPPWGYDFSDAEKKQLRQDYCVAIGASIESYDVFLERALAQLAPGGALSFVLPEAILNVRAHRPVRKIMLESAIFQYVEFLGNAFDKVQCPSIILQMAKKGGEFGDRSVDVNGTSTEGRKTLGDVNGTSTEGRKAVEDTNGTSMEGSIAAENGAIAGYAGSGRAEGSGTVVKDGAREYCIHREREMDAGCLSFSMTDQEYAVIEKMESIANKVTLAGQSKFALGIVTGNNKKYISKEKNGQNEMVLKGSDIYKFKFRPSEHYIAFHPERFQQTAPASLYRAREKLLYRFICSQLVFAYDSGQNLSLNSCNILIPEIEGLDIKYVMAVLNARAAQFYFKKKFCSVKVLRSHIEEIPIPFVGKEIQHNVIGLVDAILKEADERAVAEWYEILDDEILKLYGFSTKERKLIQASLGAGHLFLF